MEILKWICGRKGKRMWTAKEAIEVLTDKNTSIGTLKCDDVEWRKLQPAIDMAVKALEKQIPQKVIDKKMFPGNCGEIHVPNFSGKCPSCGHAIIRGVAAHKGCPYCLQALDWSE